MDVQGKYVGLEVTRDRIVAALRTGERLEVGNDHAGIAQALDQLHGAALLVLQPSDGHEHPLVTQLARAGIPVVIIPHIRLQYFAQALGEPDRHGADFIAHFADAVRPAIKEMSTKDLEPLESLFTRRSQLDEIRTSETQRLSQFADPGLLADVKAHIEWLSQRLQSFDGDLGQVLRTLPFWLAKDDPLPPPPTEPLKKSPEPDLGPQKKKPTSEVEVEFGEPPVPVSSPSESEISLDAPADDLAKTVPNSQILASLADLGVPAPAEGRASETEGEDPLADLVDRPTHVPTKTDTIRLTPGQLAPKDTVRLSQVRKLLQEEDRQALEDFRKRLRKQEGTPEPEPEPDDHWEDSPNEDVESLPRRLTLEDIQLPPLEEDPQPPRPSLEKAAPDAPPAKPAGYRPTSSLDFDLPVKNGETPSADEITLPPTKGAPHPSKELEAPPPSKKKDPAGAAVEVPAATSPTAVTESLETEPITGGPTPQPLKRELPTVAQPAASSPNGIDYELFLDCVHCGLCTSACPTYVERGDENDSPRGRIYLMRGVTDGKLELNQEVRHHLDLCLDCRACESACPSGVQYGKLIEPFRLNVQKKSASEDLSWLQRLLLFRVTPYNRRLRRTLGPARFLQWSGLDKGLSKLGLLRLLPRSLRQFHDMLPPLKKHYGALPETIFREPPRRARVALFTGCASDAFFPQTTLNTAQVLQRNGCDVWVPRTQGCCGALHYHAAQEQQAVRFAEQNCQAFLAEKPPFPIDAIIVNAAGCGAMLKDYGHLLAKSSFAEQGRQLAGMVKDVSEFLMELGPVPPTQPLKLKATYHDACHLCHGQQIRKQPRELLALIPGLEMVPLNESEICCGAAGSYNLSQPEMAERLGQRKAKHILDTQADAVFTGNVGCLIQVQRHLRKEKPHLWLAHPIDALWASYSGEKPNGLA